MVEINGATKANRKANGRESRPDDLEADGADRQRPGNGRADDSVEKQKPHELVLDDKLYAKLVSKLDVHLSEEVQYELARLVSIREEAQSKPGLEAVQREAEAAIWALVRKSPKLQFARTIRYRLEMELLRNNGMATRYLVKFTNGNPVAIIGVGVILTLVLGLLGHLALAWKLDEHFISKIFLLNGEYLPAVAAAAFFGGVVSVLSRFREFSKLRDFDPIFVFSNGFLKPYVGVLFAMFVYAFLEAGFVPSLNIVGDGAKASYVWWAVGFLAGFSERFTKDIISRSENILGGQKPGS
jgi:hypothetical protein